MELVISRPASTGDRYITARVNDTTTTTIVVAERAKTGSGYFVC